MVQERPEKPPRRDACRSEGSGLVGRAMLLFPVVISVTKKGQASYVSM
jgi:hypothetical protein